MSAIMAAIFENFIFSKIAANVLQFSRKHAFTASNMNKIKSRVEKKKFKKNLVKKSNFNLHN